MRWVLWALSGLVLLTAIVLGTMLLGVARLNPWLARRLAGGALAAALLGIACDAAWMAVRRSDW